MLTNKSEKLPKINEKNYPHTQHLSHPIESFWKVLSPKMQKNCKCVNLLSKIPMSQTTFQSNFYIPKIQNSKRTFNQLFVDKLFQLS